MKRNRFNSIISLILVLAMMFTLLTSCGRRKQQQQEEENNTDNVTCSHTNTSLQGAKAATCAAEGYTGDTVCNDCTTVVTAGTAIPKTAHTYDTGKVTKNPTCIDEGVTTFTCSGCGAIETSPIATVAHQDKFHDAQDGTHFRTCSTCTFKEQTEHRPVDEGVSFPATCTEDGYTELLCADCGGYYKVYDESLAALGHDFGEWEEKEATCKSSGKKTQECQREGCNEKNTLTIPKSGAHSYTFSHYTTVPNCTTGGKAIYYCDHCGDELKKELASNGVHRYETEGYSVDGWITKVCLYCGDTTTSFDASMRTEANVSTDNISTDKALEMTMQTAAIQFPQNVVGQIATGSSLSISADVLDDGAKESAMNNLPDDMPDEEKEMLANAPIFDFTVKVDDQVFSDNFSSKVAITIAYDNGDADEEGIVIYYLAENGEIEKITDVAYNAETKEVTFFVEHFSYYAVAYKETQAMRCKRGNHSYESTGVTVEANCYTFGYTVYECVGCHKSTFDDIVERTAHNYGELIDAHPTCDRADYITRECQNEGCNSVLNVQLVGATGHEMDHPATCTTASTCTKCNKVLTRPLGHNWGEWETVVAPTETENGIRRRYCTICGEMQESALASTGPLDSLSYDSYTELFEKLCGEVLGITSGVIEFTAYAYDEEIKYTIELMKTDRGYRGKIGIKRICYNESYNDSPDNIGEVYIDDYYYDNGVLVNVWSNSNDNKQHEHHNNLETSIYTPIDVFKVVLNDMHSQLDAYIVSGRDQLESIVDVLCAFAGDDIDEILAELGLPFYADQLHYVLDSVETVYAYLSMKLGCDTALEQVDGVKLPTAEDWENTLSVFMNSTTDANGITTYTLDEAPIVDLVMELVSYFEEHFDDTMAEFTYTVLKDTFLGLDASITDFDAFVDYLYTNFPGNYTLKDAFDLVLDAAYENGVSASELYDTINLIAPLCGYVGFDAEEFVRENGNMTLDELVQEMYGDDEMTVEDFYDELAEEFYDYTLREVYLGGTSVEELCENLRMVYDNMQLSSDLAFAVDSEGLLVSLDINHDFWVRDHFESDADYVKINAMSLNVQRNSDVTVEIPEEIAAKMRKVNYYYDNAGNLVITGLDADIEYDFSISGIAEKDFSQALQKDEALSSEYGKNIYVTKPEYWNNSTSIGEYYLIDGKYYTRTSYFNVNYIKVYGTTDFATYSTDVSSNFYVDEHSVVGYLVGHDDVPVHYLIFTEDNYRTTVGIAYCLDGVWMTSVDYGHVGNMYSDNGYDYYYVTTPMTLESFYASIELQVTDSTNSYYKFAQFNGEFYDVYNVSYKIGDRTLEASGYVVKINGEDLFVTRYDGWYSMTSFDNMIEVTELPEYDYTNEYSANVCIIDANGKLSIIEAKEINLYQRTPSYYIRITDDIYVGFSSYSVNDNFDTRGLESIVLSDGNTLYVIGESYDNDYSYKYGYKVVYGYAQTADGFYVQCALLIDGDEVVEIKYVYYSRDYINLSFDNLYDVNDYLTKNTDGSYVVSAELMNELKSLCTNPEDFFSIYARASSTTGNNNYGAHYYFGMYAIAPEVNIDDAFDNDYIDDKFFWEDLFGHNSSSANKYTVVKNDDGSITLRFANGWTVDGLSYNSNIYVPIEDQLVKDNDMSYSTGLDIYKYEDKYTGTSQIAQYVYQNGKYYEYSQRDITDLMVVDLDNYLSNWYISGFYYRFDMIGADGLPASLPVYQTSVDFRLPYTYTSGGYGTTSCDFADLYTFYLDGVLNVAIGAVVTGESLLTFDSYMPLVDYMASLEVEFSYSTSNYYSDIYLGNDKYVTLYYLYATIYEMDASGNRSYKTNHTFYYYTDNGVKKAVNDYWSYRNSELIIGQQVSISHISVDAIKDTYTTSYANGTFTLVTFSEEREYCNTHYYVKLAGRYYLYNDYKYYDEYCYLDQRLDEWDFNYQATDKAWVYMVEVYDEYGNYVETVYYSEFIPTDLYFIPSGNVVDPSIIGDVYSTTLFGYTAEGYPMHEVAYWVVGDDSPYTREVQSDGTVFLHKNGVGYLEVNQNGYNYYVRARKVTLTDGTTAIYCMLRGAVIRPYYLYGDDLMDKYVTYTENSVTISAEFLELITSKHNTALSILVNGSFYSDLHFDYYELESLFMIAQ